MMKPTNQLLTMTNCKATVFISFLHLVFYFFLDGGFTPDMLAPKKRFKKTPHVNKQQVVTKIDGRSKEARALKKRNATQTKASPKKQKKQKIMSTLDSSDEEDCGIVQKLDEESVFTPPS